MIYEDGSSKQQQRQRIREDNEIRKDRKSIVLLCYFTILVSREEMTANLEGKFQTRIWLKSLFSRVSNFPHWFWDYDNELASRNIWVHERLSWHLRGMSENLESFLIFIKLACTKCFVLQNSQSLSTEVLLCCCLLLLPTYHKVRKCDALIEKSCQISSLDVYFPKIFVFSFHLHIKTEK